MRVGIYTDLRNPPGWPRLGGALRATMRPDRRGRAPGRRLGLGDRAPLLRGRLPPPAADHAAAAIAGRTARLRIGTAVLLAPLRPPLQIAEEAAIVDLVSGGRLELGLGAGYRVPEFAAFGADPARRFALLRETVRELRRIWDEGACTPPPVQDPVPLLGSAS